MAAAERELDWLLGLGALKEAEKLAERLGDELTADSKRFIAKSREAQDALRRKDEQERQKTVLAQRARFAGSPRRLRVFISTPGDVTSERLRVELIVDRLAQDYKRFFTIETYRWEYEPMLATGHFQDLVDFAGVVRHFHIDPLVASRNAAAGADKGAGVSRN